LAKSRDFNDTEWRTLNLPHDWSIEGLIAPENSTAGAGGYFPAGYLPSTFYSMYHVSQSF
jgi:beta-galactosidase